MFASRYFAPRYFAPRYWPKFGLDAVVNPITPGRVSIDGFMDITGLSKSGIMTTSGQGVSGGMSIKTQVDGSNDN